MNGRTGFAAAFQVREFRVLWLTQAQSVAGDQLARVGLSVLVFARTGSAVLTAATYALTFAPAIFGGILLGRLADRYSRRAVMVTCDLCRAICFGVMALPVVPLPVTCLLLVIAVLVGQPFLAAETAILPDILSGETYVLASGIRMMTSQVAQLAGFAGGGIAVAALGPHRALAINAVSFLLSALIIRIGLRPRARQQVKPGTTTDRRLLAGLRVVRGDRLLLLLAAFGWLSALHIAPEALAVPYAAELGAGPLAVGLLMAAPPTGTALGLLLFLRLGPRARLHWMGPLAVASGAPMLLCALRPDLVASLGLWFLLGMFTAYQVQASASFVQLVPDHTRGQVVGFVASAMIASQGLGALLMGVLGQHLGAERAVGAAGLASCAIALFLAGAGRSQLPALAAAQQESLPGPSD